MSNIGSSGSSGDASDSTKEIQELLGQWKSLRPKRLEAKRAFDAVKKQENDLLEVVFNKTTQRQFKYEGKKITLCSRGSEKTGKRSFYFRGLDDEDDTDIIDI